MHSARTAQIRSRLLILIGSAMLAACTPMQWVKPGGTPEQFSEDAASCQEEARREAWFHLSMRPRVPVVVQDAQGRRFVIWERDPFGDFADRSSEEFRLSNFCLTNKGYRLVPVPKPG
jgi:hypothetical protein